jgi:hypothetical protein
MLQYIERNEEFIMKEGAPLGEEVRTTWRGKGSQV